MILLPRSTGPPSNDSYGPRILAACWAVGALSTIFLGLRMYCKVKRSRQAWYDDYVLILAWLCQTADIILITVNVSIGAGQHMSNLSRSVLPILEKNGNVSGTLSITAAVLSKTSFGITLLRLTSGYTKGLVWFLLVTMNIALFLSALFIWVDPVRPGHSPSITSYNMFSGVYSALVDFALALIPWPLVWGLRMRRREKIGVAAAMSMGIFAGIGAIAKVIQLPNLSHGDFTYHVSGVLIWGTVESAVTIMAVSVPFLRILVVEARWAPRPRLDFLLQPKMKISTDSAEEQQGIVQDGAGSRKGVSTTEESERYQTAGNTPAQPSRVRLSPAVRSQASW